MARRRAANAEPSPAAARRRPSSRGAAGAAGTAGSGEGGVAAHRGAEQAPHEPRFPAHLAAAVPGRRSGAPLASGARRAMACGQPEAGEGIGLAIARSRRQQRLRSAVAGRHADQARGERVSPRHEVSVDHRSGCPRAIHLRLLRARGPRVRVRQGLAVADGRQHRQHRHRLGVVGGLNRKLNPGTPEYPSPRLSPVESRSTTVRVGRQLLHSSFARGRHLLLHRCCTCA
mmetsp:Transcript_68409/g.198333  ORF Transcript_68409/g.198333 Transcript_68409/m.198333 type:complete len:230 (-) Transcript_68409:15-704(-)